MPDCNTKYNRFIHMNINQIFLFLGIWLLSCSLSLWSSLPVYFVTILIINLTSLQGTGCEVLPNTPDMTTLTLLCRVLTGLEIKYNPGNMWSAINLEEGKLHWHYLFFLSPNSAVNKIKFLFLILESFWEKSLSE